MLNNLKIISNSLPLLKNGQIISLFGSQTQKFSRKLYTLSSPNECRNQLPKKVQDLVKDYPSVTNIYLQWGEMDAFGHLNNAAFLRFFESGRLAFYHQLIGPRLSKNSEFSHGTKKIGPIVKTVKCNYKAPIVYPDTLCIATRVPVESIKKDRYTYEAIMISEKLEKIAAKSEVVMVTYDYRKNKKTEIPNDFKDLLYKLQKKQ